MKEYWLMQNLIYDCKHVVVKTWWRQALRVLGFYSLRLATVKAASKVDAEKLFRTAGFNFGIFN
tara:strand:- start:86 stop:277 length:192 start_codon:yes stop_codon:yes gene_type:complete